MRTAPTKRALVLADAIAKKDWTAPPGVHSSRSTKVLCRGSRRSCCPRYPRCPDTRRCRDANRRPVRKESPMTTALVLLFAFSTCILLARSQTCPLNGTLV